MRPTIIIVTLYAFSGLLYANPINPYVTYPAISEVQWIDSATWSIELDKTVLTSLSNAIFCSSLEEPCTTTTVRLYLTSSKQVYSTRVVFNDSGLGVLTPSSITRIPATRQVLIRSIDTIFIPDPSYDESEPIDSLFPYQGWICPIYEPKSGNSLIGCKGGVFISSSRSSIGTRGNYTTIHHLHIINRNNRPIINTLYAYTETKGQSNLGFPTFTFSLIATSDANGVMTFPANLGNDRTLALQEYSIGSTYTYNPIESGNLFPPFYAWPCTWESIYIDTILECTDTLHYKPNYQKIRIIDPTGIPLKDLSSSSPGEEIGTGEFLFRLFPGYSHSINFSNSTATVAQCTCSYVDTSDTLLRTLTSSFTNVKTPSGNISSLRGSAKLFSIIGKLSDGVLRFVIAAQRPFRHAAIKVYTANGRIVTIIDVPSKIYGTYTVRWNGNTLSGKKLSSGNYICKLLFDGKVVASQMVPFF